MVIIFYEESEETLEEIKINHIFSQFHSKTLEVEINHEIKNMHDLSIEELKNFILISKSQNNSNLKQAVLKLCGIRIKELIKEKSK